MADYQNNNVNLIGQRLAIMVYLPTEDLKTSQLETLYIKIERVDKNTQDIIYLAQLPDRLFYALSDSDEETYRSKQTAERLMAKKHPGQVTEKDRHFFKKTIRSTQISHIVKTINDHTHHLNTVKSAQDVPREKLIFFSFNGSTAHLREGTGSAYAGERTNISLQFFTGYRIEIPPRPDFWSGDPEPEGPVVKKYSYHTDRIYRTPAQGRGSGYEIGINQLPYPALEGFARDNVSGYTTKDFLGKYRLIPWTEEREAFLTRIQAELKNVASTLNAFLGDMDTDKLDMLITSNTQILINNG